jgi:hypothetical protein
MSGEGSEKYCLVQRGVWQRSSLSLRSGGGKEFERLKKWGQFENQI